MRRLPAAARQLSHALGYTAVTVTVVALTPLVLFGGELVNRHYLGTYTRVRPRRLRRGAGQPRGSVHVVHVSWLGNRPGRQAASYGWDWLRVGALPAAVLSNPAWIALTAPARWLLGHLRPLAGRGRRGRGGGPPPAGVREPRRPRPDQPAGVVELPEPR